MDEISTVGRLSVPQEGRIPLVAAVYTLGLTLFLTIDPVKPWLLLFIAILVGLSIDGIIRSKPDGLSRQALDTAPYLLVPVLLALAAGFFLEATVSGYWRLLAAAVSGGLMAIALYGEYVSVDTNDQLYPTGRFILNVVTYLTAFALFAAIYSFDVALVPAALATGLVSAVLAAEILRESELMPPPVARRSLRSLGLAVVIGLIIAQVRWALYFAPLDGFLAAVFLLLFFYVATGIVQHYLTAQLSSSIFWEFAIVASVGLLMIVLGKAFAAA